MFKEQLKQVMQDLKLNQSKLSILTGIGKSSISQYLSGKNTPTEDRQRDIAVSLGLSPDYFSSDSGVVVPVSNAAVKKLLPEDAARLMGISKESIRKGLQDGVFPWGYAIHTSERWTYFINAKKFAEVEGVELEGGN